MLKRFSTLFAFLFAISVASSWAQTFTYNTGTTWQTAAGWTAAMGATGFPGQASNNGDVTIAPVAALPFGDAPPAFPISSLTVSGTSIVTMGVGTLTVTGNFNLAAGATLNIPASATLVVNGSSTISGTLVLQAATSRVIFNGPVTQSGAGVINAVNMSTVQLGVGVGNISGTLFQNPFLGTIQTGGALNLTSNLTMGATGVLNLVGTTTLNAGVTLTVNNTGAGAITGAGNLQGASANSTVNLATGPTAIQGTWFANPYNGTLITPTAASTLAGTLTIGASGILNLGAGGLGPAGGGTNLILNNTGANSLTGTGTLNVTANLTVTLGPGFNGSTLNGDRFAVPVLGTINTGGNLTATSAGALILRFDNGSVFNVTGTLTIAAGKTISINNTTAGALPGTGTFAATDNTSIMSFAAGANAGIISGAIFSNPWNGRIQTLGALQLGTTLNTDGTSVLSAGPNAIFDLGGDLTVNDSLFLGCTQSAALAFQGGAGRIVARNNANTPAPAGGSVTIGANTFAGFFPAARLGTGTAWAAGSIFVAGSSALGVNYTFQNNAFLFLGSGAVLQVASSVTATLDGRVFGGSTLNSPNWSGRINGQDNTAIVSLTANFRDAANTTNLPGAMFGNLNFDGNLTIGQARTLSGSLRMGANSIYTTGGFATTVNTPDTLYFNQTAAAGLAGAGTFIGTGTLNFGANALGATFPTAAVPSGAAPANFGGRIILGDGVNFAANYNVQNSTLLQLNGNTQVNAGIILTITNNAANTLSGTGRLTAQAANSEVNFAAGANGGTVPGANFASPYIGRIVTGGAMNLTGSLNMGASAVLSLAGNLTLANTSVVTLGMTAAPGTSLPGAGLLVGQPSGANVPEIILASGALGGQVPIPGDIVTGAAAGEFGGRLSVGTGYAITANTTINQPAILNVQTGAQLLVNAGVTLNLNTTSTPATGPGTGVIQGQDNTAIIAPANGYNGSTFPGASLANPFAGQLIIPTNGLNLSGNLTMGVASILLMNGNLNVNPGTTLTLNGGNNSLQSGGGLLNGGNAQAVVALGAAFNGGSIPANRFTNPFNGTLTTAGPMTLVGAMTFGASSALTLGGNLTVPASTILQLNMTGANTLTGTGRFVAAAASSTVALGTNFNNAVIPGANFTDFNGLVTMVSTLSLGSSLTLGSTGVLDIGGGINRLVLGNSGANLSLANPIRNTSATAFVVTNGDGGLVFNNPALTSFFYPIGSTTNSYTPLSLSNGGTADVFTVRVRPGITNSPTTFPNFVNVEWVITQGGAGTRPLRLAPQWATANQQGSNFNTNAVGVGLFLNNAYVQSATGAAISVGSGLFTSGNGNFTATFSSTPLVAYSQVILPPPTVIQPVISGITPQTFPVSNDPFTVQFTGTNLLGIRTITARNLNSNAQVTGTIVNQVGSLLTVSFPGIVRGIAGTVQVSMTNATVPGFTTANLTITPISSPTLTAVTPSTTASGNAYTVTLTGTGFLSQSIFTVNNAAVRLMNATTATSVSLEIPAALNRTSNTLTFAVRNTDNQTASIAYTIGQSARPNITNIAPRAVFAGSSDLTINVEGSGFFGNGFITALFNTVQIPVNVVSSTRLTLTVPANLLTQVGFPSILISNSDAQSIGYVFTILERAPLGPTPVLTSFTPSTTTASGRAFSVVLNGSNFSPNALVTVRGNVVTPVSGDTNRYVVEVPANLNTAEPLDIVIQNPDLQFVRASIQIGTRLPAPVLNSITPLTTEATTTPRAFTITVSGSNFTTNATVLLNGRPLQIVSQSATSIVAIVASNRPPDVNFNPAENRVVVLNGDGQASSAAVLIVTTGVSVLDNTLPGFSVYPSPVHDVMTIHGGFERSSNVVISINNILGQRVVSFTDEQVSGAYSRQLNVSNLPVGSYIVEITDGARRFVQKVIKY